MNIQTDYYLEALITDAFKGQGFQKISELFEDQVLCSPQRYSKGLLNQLDRLINKELDRNEFQHVSLLMKCVQHFCKSECHEGSSLVQQGLVPKMVLWFERTLEFLKICKDSGPISPVVEDFYDTAMVISKVDSADGVNQLLDTFVYTLGFVTMEKWPPCHIRLEAIKTFNFILDHISKEERKKLISSEDMCTLMQGLARKLMEVGDYDFQVAIAEALCRTTPKKMRDNFVENWFEDGSFTEAFKEINDKDFETDCRKFLNLLNSSLKDTIRVHTFPCIRLSTDTGELEKPQDDKLQHLWIDFNVGSHCVSFYIQNNKGGLWETVRLPKGSLSGYTLEESTGQQLLNINLKMPQSINDKEVKFIKMYFELEHDIHNATIQTYGEDLQMDGSKRSIKANAVHSTETNAVKSNNKKSESNIKKDSDSSCTLRSPNNNRSSATKLHLESPQHTDRSKNLQDGFTGSDGASSGDQMSAIGASDARVLEFTEEKKLPEASSKTQVVARKSHHGGLGRKDKKRETEKLQSERTSLNSMPIANEVEERLPKQQSAEKREFDIFEFPESSVSISDIEVCTVKEQALSPTAASSRKSDTPNRPITRSCVKSEAKKAVDYKDFLSSGTDMSWTLEYQRKPSAKSADYSRKRQKSKSKLKVLPLSSQSSEEDVKPKKRGHPLKYTVIKKKRERGIAESLSFSELKLPGVSGLLTPMHSCPQASGTLHLSDLYKDTMDPLQEMSSPEDDNCEKPPLNDAAIKMDDERNEDQIELIKGLYPLSKAADLEKKRKRLSNEEEEEFTLKPCKLFSSDQKKEIHSSNLSGDLEDVFKSDSHESELTECSFISSFESFTEDLKKKVMTRNKWMEDRAQHVLAKSHSHVSSLMNQIQKSTFQKLDHFRRVVAQELSSLEAETQTLKELEKETLDFWEAQTVKINEFCTKQRQRIEAVDGTIKESLSILKKNEEKNTKIKESL